MKGTTYSPARFKPTYKGWKPAITYLLKVFQIQVLSLPTRDGNLEPKCSNSSLEPCFKPTYKGWKPVSFGGKDFSPLVLSLPTRDGNIKERREKKCLTIGFKPTYKGWKRENDIITCDGGKCFKPTYKGWKCRGSWWALSQGCEF